MNIKEIQNPKAKIPSSVFQQLTYSSPLPPPEVLHAYEKAQPGLVQKIIEITEIQGKHRRELELKSLRGI